MLRNDHAPTSHSASRAGAGALGDRCPRARDPSEATMSGARDEGAPALRRADARARPRAVRSGPTAPRSGAAAAREGPGDRRSRHRPGIPAAACAPSRPGSGAGRRASRQHLSVRVVSHLPSCATRAGFEPPPSSLGPWCDCISPPGCYSPAAGCAMTPRPCRPTVQRGRWPDAPWAGHKAPPTVVISCWGSPVRVHGWDQFPSVRRRCGGGTPPSSPAGVCGLAAAHLQSPAFLMHPWTTSFPWYPHL